MEELLKTARSRILPACFHQPCFVGVIENERPEAAVYYKRLELGLYISFRKRYANPDKKSIQSPMPT